MNQALSREAVKEIVARIVGQFENQLASAGLATSPQTPAPSHDQAQPGAPPAYFAPWTGEVYPAAHPSQQQFTLTESPADQSVAHDVLQFTPGQPCVIEKGKPCDQCGSCRVLGF